MRAKYMVTYNMLQTAWTLYRSDRVQLPHALNKNDFKGFVRSYYNDYQISDKIFNQFARNNITR